MSEGGRQADGPLNLPIFFSIWRNRQATMPEELRRRRPAASNEEPNKKDDESTAIQQKKNAGGAAAQSQDDGTTIGVRRKKSNLRSKKFPILPCGAFLGVIGFILSLYYRRYGIQMFVDRSFFDLAHSADEWRDIMADKTVVLLGGPHRAGTTILWKAIAAHPDVSGFGTSQETGVDESEGILLQDVYSRHGIGMEDIMSKVKHYENQMLGVGRYALQTEEKVHLTESDPRITRDNLVKILNRFGQYWNMSQPVLIEKSPPTMTMSRFLQAMYHVNDNDGSGDDTKKTEGPKVKFIFITRHPIANMMAHENMVGKHSHLTYEVLMRNYIQMHNYLLEDVKDLDNDPLILRLEDFAADPAAHLAKIYSWIGIDADDATVKEVLDERLGAKIWPDPNKRYRERWCGKAEKDNMSVHKRNGIVAKFQTAIKEDLARFDYDLESWCDY